MQVSAKKAAFAHSCDRRPASRPLLLQATAPDEAEGEDPQKKRPKSAVGAAKRDARRVRPAAVALRNMRSSGRRGSAACGPAGKEASAACGEENAEMEGWVSLLEFCCSSELHLPPGWWLAGAAAVGSKGQVEVEG